MKQYFVRKCNNAKCNNIYWYNWEIWEFAFLSKILQRCAALKMLPWNITFIVAIATNGQLTFTTKIFVEKITELNLTTILSLQERLEIVQYCFDSKSQLIFSILLSYTGTVKPLANGRNIVGQQLCWMYMSVRLHTLLHVVTCCWD